MLEARNLTFKYGERYVLKNISFRLPRGRILGIVGPNGAGKTTLLKCILGILCPKYGEVTVDGQDIQKIPPAELAKLIAYVPQSCTSRFPMTLFDAVLLGRKPHISWFPKHKDISKVHEILKVMNLDHLAMKDFDHLSGGQKQKVILARALVQETDYILMDEPTSNLDLKYQLQVMELVRNVSKNKQTGIIIAIHDLNLAINFTDEIMMLKGGLIFGHGRPAEVLTEKAVRAVYQVQVKKIKTCGQKYLVPIASLPEKEVVLNIADGNTYGKEEEDEKVHSGIEHHCSNYSSNRIRNLFCKKST